jgi:hypothetical protein
MGARRKLALTIFSKAGAIRSTGDSDFNIPGLATQKRPSRPRKKSIPGLKQKCARTCPRAFTFNLYF